MKLYKEILAKALEKEEMIILFPNLQLNANELVQTKCYQALQTIKSIIEDEGLSDFECVEQIVCVFEQLGSSGGSRHDF